MADRDERDDEYRLSPLRRQLRLAIGRFAQANHPIVGASAERVSQIEGEILDLLVQVRMYERRNLLTK